MESVTRTSITIMSAGVPSSTDDQRSAAQLEQMTGDPSNQGKTLMAQRITIGNPTTNDAGSRLVWLASRDVEARPIMRLDVSTR